jgi:hypothetical protein
MGGQLGLYLGRVQVHSITNYPEPVSPNEGRRGKRETGRGKSRESRFSLFFPSPYIFEDLYCGTTIDGGEEEKIVGISDSRSHGCT